ncbi:uncharacterized protein LOC118418965 [Branchiostoma floridae]|uniref:Uncharacterized protein LOC118418965 n=1 Tax=Branchiostoma floridae TaxID=7739 RepID=A0A9J7LEH4_BRAFL|nr:uncharacterized protein LOC118418965 [Branchiostoma floridae]
MRKRQKTGGLLWLIHRQKFFAPIRDNFCVSFFHVLSFADVMTVWVTVWWRNDNQVTAVPSSDIPEFDQDKGVGDDTNALWKERDPESGQMVTKPYPVRVLAIGSFSSMMKAQVTFGKIFCKEPKDKDSDKDREEGRSRKRTMTRRMMESLSSASQDDGVESDEAVAAKKAPKSSATQKGKKTGQKTAVTEKSAEKDAAASAVEVAAERKASAEKKATEEREKAAVTDMMNMEKDQLVKAVVDCWPYLDGVKDGTTVNARHKEYETATSWHARRDMDYGMMNTIDIVTDDQAMIIADLMIERYGFKEFDYIWKVLLPEFLVHHHATLKGISHKEAEINLRTGKAKKPRGKAASNSGAETISAAKRRKEKALQAEERAETVEILGQLANDTEEEAPNGDNDPDDEDINSGSVCHAGLFWILFYNSLSS